MAVIKKEVCGTWPVHLGRVYTVIKLEVSQVQPLKIPGASGQT